MNNRNREESLTLEILETIEGQSNVSQRHLAERLGVALGLANSYLKRCVRKGLIKIDQAPANRYLYYLTPRGFAEKSRLTAEYLTYSFDFYRRASTSCTKVFQDCHACGYYAILLCGKSELAEIASLRAKEQRIQIVGILDKNEENKKFLGVPIITSIERAPAFDACLITDIKHTSETLDELALVIPSERILIPDLFGIKINKLARQ